MLVLVVRGITMGTKFSMGTKKVPVQMYPGRSSHSSTVVLVNAEANFPRMGTSGPSSAKIAPQWSKGTAGGAAVYPRLDHFWSFALRLRRSAKKICTSLLERGASTSTAVLIQLYSCTTAAALPGTKFSSRSTLYQY